MLPLPHKLKEEAKQELYQLVDKHYKKLPKNSDGSINEFADGFQDNDIDALRHAYVSGVFTQVYNESFADFLGKMQEILPGHGASSPTGQEQTNMDLWNNFIGRKHGKKARRGEELFFILLDALKKGELIVDPKDPRKYKETNTAQVNSDHPIIVAKESETGENLIFYDVNKQSFLDKTAFIQLIRSGSYLDYEIRNLGGKETPFSKKDQSQVNNLG